MIELENRKSSATMLNNSNSNSTTEVFDVDNTSTANVESLQQQCASSAGSTNNPENSTAATPLDYDIEKCSDRERLDTGETDESVVDSQSPRQQQQQQLEPNVTIIDSNNDDDRTTIVTTYCFTKRVCCLRIVLFFLILGIVVFIITDTMTNGYIKTFIFNFLQWIEDNPVSGIFIYTLVYFLSTIFFGIPASLMMIGAGYIFTKSFPFGIGFVIAIVTSFTGACTSAIVSFGISKFIIRDLIKQITNKYTLIRALDYAIQRNGLKIFILLRLSPLIPFKTINYVAGGTSVTFRDYCISLIAMIPGIVLGVVIGASMSSLTEAPHANDNDKNGNRTIAIIVSVIGVVFSIAAMILVTIYTRKELNKAAAAANINNNYTINDTTNDEVILENDTVQASERLTESDVVDALVDAIHDVQAHALAGMNGEGVHVGCNNNNNSNIN